MDANEQLERAYWLGWRNCAAWAERKDLWADRDSQAYTQERDDDLGSLAALAQQVPADGEVKAWLIRADNGMAIKCVMSEQERDALLFRGESSQFPEWTATPLVEAATPQAPQPVVDASQPQQGAVDVEVLRAFERKFWQAVSLSDSRDFDHDVCKEVRDFRDVIAALAAHGKGG